MNTHTLSRRIVLLLLLLLTRPPLPAAAPAATPLAPFEYLYGQLLDLDGDPVRYALSGLKPATSYELRVSWPASVRVTTAASVRDRSSATGTANARAAAVTQSPAQMCRRTPQIPASIHFKLVDGDAPHVTQQHRFARRLLDCENFVLTTDEHGTLQVRLQCDENSWHRLTVTLGGLYSRTRRSLRHVFSPSLVACVRRCALNALHPCLSVCLPVCLSVCLSWQGLPHPEVWVSAARRSVHRDGVNGGVRKLVYNIGAYMHIHTHTYAAQGRGDSVGNRWWHPAVMRGTTVVQSASPAHP
jgi:hypothetical protein